MKSLEQVDRRLKGLLLIELDRRIERANRRVPELCVHNYRHPLDERKLVEGQDNTYYNRVTVNSKQPVSKTIGLCMYGHNDPESWTGNICEDEIDAKRCPLFQSKSSKASIMHNFYKEVVEMPDIRELMWVLGLTEVPKLPWWKRFWFNWVLRINTEVIKPYSVAGFLPESEYESADSESGSGS